jgi:hypothetical protein
MKEKSGNMRMLSFQLFQDTERRARARTGVGILLSVLLIVTSILAIVTIQRFTVKAAPIQTLPGQQVWRQGTSSLLFGANDASWQWSSKNLGNNPAIAAAVRTAGITVIRAPLHVSDAQARVSAIEAAGAKCLGILDPADAEQVVKMLGNRCEMYEWMNEPDNGGPAVDAYASSWNQHIPTLRSINPNAIYIGPVVASPNLGYIQRFLTLAKQAGNIPDVVSYHMYTCTDQTIANCPSHIAAYGTAASQVGSTVNQVLGYNLPLAVTEWNYSWKPNQTPQNDPFIKTFTAQSIDAMAQAGIAMATQFDIASGAGGGTLDMVDPQSGQSLPQLDAMHQAIQSYQLQPATPTPPAATNTPPGGLKPLPIQTQVPVPTQAQTPPPNKPTAVNQPPPIVVVGAPSGAGTFIVGQQLHCEPGAPVNSQLNMLGEPAGTNTLAQLGITQDGCGLTFKVQQPDQTMRLNWWNVGMAITNRLTFQISSDSTDGMDGTWQAVPATSFIAAGGSQLVSLQGQSWARVSVEPPVGNESPVNLVMELYTLNAPTDGGGSSPAPIALPRN